jgi:hypothetical protein
MRVNSQNGGCRQCQGELGIIDADDATMTVCCLDCGDSYVVETDACNDGGIHYWPRFVAEERE